MRRIAHSRRDRIQQRVAPESRAQQIVAIAMGRHPLVGKDILAGSGIRRGEVVGVVMQAASEKETKVSVIRRIGILLSLR
ncbi:MAG: hypothetical protein IPH50_09390 [Rhodanobacteraceae bacterium]|nr:hypothetical protein [Rhodanobacteraceae bacterium]